MKLTKNTTQYNLAVIAGSMLLVGLVAVLLLLRPLPAAGQVDLRNAPGAPFHGEFSGTGADTPANEAAARFSLYHAGTTVALTLGPTDQVVITDIQFSVTNGANGYIFDGADTTVDAGERVLTAYGANIGDNPQTTLLTPRVLQPGSWPKLKSSTAGQIDATIHGYIISP